MSDNSAGGISIIGLIILAVLIYLIIKKFWLFMWIALGILVVVILVAILLVASSKKAKSEENSLKDRIRNLQSKIRKQIFKAENNIKRLTEWANDAIYTTYGELFGDKYTKSELLENFDKIKVDYVGQVENSQAEKCEQIVNGYRSIIETEKLKLEKLRKMKEEYDSLYKRIVEAERNMSKSKKLNKHFDKIEKLSGDISGDKTLVESELNFEQIHKDLEFQEEYFKQLEELSTKYSLDRPVDLDGYKDNLEKILQNI